MVFHIWGDLSTGNRVDVVAESIILDCGDHHIMRMMGTGEFMKVRGLPETGAHTWTMLGVLVESDEGVKQLLIDDSATVFPHFLLALGNLGKCIELCAGAGFMSTGARAAGLESIAGFEQNEKFEPMFAANGGRNFCCLDIHSSECVKHAFRLGGQSAVVLSGIACQPYSKAGDEKGGGDCRSGTLPATLKVAWLIQSPIVILECTPTAMTNAFVQTQIKQFAQQAGYHVFQQVLHLDRQWVGKRDRWWCVLSARPLGQVRFEDLPEATDFKVVSDVMQSPCAWPDTELAALELTLYEHHKIHCCSKGLDSLLLNFQAPLPTALHSWGNQCYRCACGCRAAFSERRLNERGVFAVLISLGSVIKHEGHTFPKCRHLHPSEVAVLSGARVIPWGGSMRLGLAAVGQMASPLQAVWVCSHVVSTIAKFTQVPTHASPAECLSSLRASVLHDCELLWPKVVTPIEPQGLEPRVDVSIRLGHLPTKIILPIRVTGMTQVQSLVRAEAVCWDCDVNELVCTDEDGTILQDGFPVRDGMLVWIGTRADVDRVNAQVSDDTKAQPNDGAIPLAGEQGFAEMVVADVPVPRDMDLPLDFWASPGDSVDVQKGKGHLGYLPQAVDQLLGCKDVEGSISGDALIKLKCKGLLALVPPQVFSNSALCGIRSQMISQHDRLCILTNQEGSWGDDEIRYHLHRLVADAPVGQVVTVWDPLMTTSLVKSLQGTLIDAVILSTPEVATIITAVVIEGHWIPLVWRKEAGSVMGFSCGVPKTHLLIVQSLHAWLCMQWNVPVTYIRVVDQHMPDFCGAATISYIEHLVLGKPMMMESKQCRQAHEVYRHQFMHSLGAITHRPWVWGRGTDSPDPVMIGLLRQHGVSAADASSRAEHVTKHLGREAVQKAIQSARPWQELKWLANQKVPPYQLIRPSELQAAIDNRSKSDTPLGSKRQKQKGGGKGKGKQSNLVLEPDSLRLESGVFMVGEGKPVSQLALGEIGPMAIGVVLATLDQALPFITQNRQVSMGGLAIVVLNVNEAPPGLPLIAEPIRFPAVCAANAEPVLVQGLLFQLGQIPIRRAAKTDPVAMECIQTFVAKMVIFRDGVHDWDSVVKQPVRYIQQHFSCLIPCRDEDCAKGCGKWHSGSEIHIDDPIMALWNRQWMKGNFVACPPDDASMFVVSIRVPVELENGLIAKSGSGSVVVEPRELDGRQVSRAYHVVWLPNQQLTQAQVLRQTTEGALGLARIGDKWGLRCRAEQAAKIHKLIKPSTEYLPSGTKMHYLVGPVPYGTVKQSIVQACKAIEWEVRPLFATPAPRTVEGIMYKVQSVVAPPRQVIPLQEGEAVITRCDHSNAKVTSHVPVVGSSASVQLVHQPAKATQDMLQVNDPWAAWNAQSKGSDAGSSSTRVSVEQQVVEAVLARLPREVIDIDQNMDGSDRVAALEAQVASINEKQAELHQNFLDHANTQAAQVSQLQNQFQAQHCQLETAVAEQGRQLQGLGNQFQMQMEKQQNQLDGMFHSQMQRLEDLLSKRSRHE